MPPIPVARSRRSRGMAKRHTAAPREEKQKKAKQRHTGPEGRYHQCKAEAEEHRPESRCYESKATQQKAGSAMADEGLDFGAPGDFTGHDGADGLDEGGFTIALGDVSPCAGFHHLVDEFFAEVAAEDDCAR